MSDSQLSTGFAIKLKREREMLGISISRLSELCGIAPESLKKLESGQADVTIDMFSDLLKAMHFEAYSSVKQQTDTKAQARQALQQATLTELSKHQFVVHGQTQKAIELITETLSKVLNAPFVGVWFFNEANDLLYPIDEYILDKNSHEPKNRFTKEEFPETFNRILNIHSRNLISKNKKDFFEVFPEFKEDNDKWGILSVLETTIISYDKVIGMISCDDIVERVWNLDEISFVDQVAHLITTTLHNEENLKLKNEIGLHKIRLGKQQETILDFIKNKDVIDGNVKEALDYIAKKTTEVFEVNDCTIWQIKSDPNLLECVVSYEAGYGYYDNLSRWDVSHANQPKWFDQIRAGHVVADEDLYSTAYLKEFKHILDEWSLKSGLDVGIRIAGNLVGCITVESKFNRAWTLDEQMFLGAIADQIAQCMINQQRKKSERQLRLLSRAVEHSSSAVFVADIEQTIQYCNPQFCELLGMNEHNIVGMSLKKLPITNNTLSNFLTMLNKIVEKDSWQGEIEVYKKNESTWVILSCSPIYGDNGVYTGEYIFVCENISQLKQAMLQLEQIASYDTLTGLANRHFFKENLINRINLCENANTEFAMLYLDLDRFKQINDTFGHDAGDSLLKTVAARLKSSLRETDTLARLGGDEFTVILFNVRIPEDIEAIVQKIKSELSKPIEFNGRSLTVTASIGISVYPHHSKDYDQLMKCADIAMYHAKSTGRGGHQYYSENIDVFSPERLSLEHELRHALERKQFFINYQPIINARTNSLASLEALIRWQHPTMGLIPPIKFISLAEDLGLIGDIGDWVLQQACHDIKSFQTIIPNVSVAVNLAANQFSDNALIDKVRAALTAAQLDGSCLVLEITESMLMNHIEESITILNQLNMLGVKLSIDDFGTGYSSLAYIKKLPIEHLKIDRTFIKNINNDEHDKAITASVISMAHQLNLTVVAEGVEQIEHLNILKHYGCDFYQGFYFSKPCAMGELIKNLPEILKE